MKTKTLGVSIALSLGLAAASQAAIVATGDITVTASGAQSGNSSGSDSAHTADGSGLSATLTDANLATVTHVAGFSASTQYLGQGTTGTFDATLIYTFSSALTDQLSTIAVWNFAQSGQVNRWADSVDVSVNTGSGLVSMGTFNLTSADGTSAVASDLIDLSGFNLVGATQVTLKINQGKLDTHNNYTSGLGEVAFQTTAVPEPSSAALLGLGGLALILRRRK